MINSTMSQDKFVYPERYEIQEVCENFIKRRHLNQMMQEKGIFGISASTKELSQIMSNCIFDAVTIDDFRKNAIQCSNRNNLSGFLITSSAKDLSVKDIYEKARDNSNLKLSRQYRLGMLVKETRDGKDYFKGKLDYEIRRPGRIQFMDKETGSCEFYMFETKNNEWQVEVDGTRSSDGKEVQKLFTQLVDKSITRIHVLDIDCLKDKQTIEFFDEIIKRGLPDEWKFQDVVALTFRRGRDEVEENIENEDEEKSKTTPLTGIRQAILEGGNLRDNEFVHKFEENGCIFSAMTLEYQNASTPETIHIRAEFKGSPKIFEVSIVNIFENEGLEAKKEQSSLSVKKNLEVRTAFWNNARIIYNEIVSKQ